MISSIDIGEQYRWSNSERNNHKNHEAWTGPICAHYFTLGAPKNKDKSKSLDNLNTTVSIIP